MFILVSFTTVAVNKTNLSHLWRCAVIASLFACVTVPRQPRRFRVDVLNSSAVMVNWRSPDDRLQPAAGQLQHQQHCYHHHHNRLTALFPGPPGWAGAGRELLDFMVQGKINRGRHTVHPAGRHSIRTNQCPPPPSPATSLVSSVSPSTFH